MIQEGEKDTAPKIANLKGIKRKAIKAKSKKKCRLATNTLNKHIEKKNC